MVAALLAHDVPLVAVGGAAASTPLSAQTQGAIRIPDRVVEAAASIADAVGRRGR